MDLGKLVLLALPLVLINYAVVAVCLVDWTRRRRFRHLSPWSWLALILLVQFVGPILYLTAGRGDSHD
jgi:hypothetical protein